MASSRIHALFIFCSTKPLHGHQMATAIPGITSRPDSAQQRRQHLPMFLFIFPVFPFLQNSSYFNGSELVHVAIPLPTPSKRNRVTVASWAKVENSKENEVSRIRKRGCDFCGGISTSHKLHTWFLRYECLTHGRCHICVICFPHFVILPRAQDWQPWLSWPSLPPSISEAWVSTTLLSCPLVPSPPPPFVSVSTLCPQWFRDP